MKSLLKLFIILILADQSALAAGQVAVLVNPSKVTFAEFYEKYTAVGQFKHINSKDYFAKVSGKVDFVSGVQGSSLSKDNVLVTIDKEIADQLKAQAEANLYLAESNYNRDLSLLKKKFISEEVVNTSKAGLEKARNEYTKALNTYEDMIIRAPYDAYLGVIKVNVGDEVKANDYLFSLISKSDFHTFIELPQNLHGKVRITDEVNAIIGSSDEKLAGKILAISDYASTTGTITAKLQFPYSSKLLHGSFVSAEIVFNRHKALALPEKAVLKNNQGNFVYAITPENKAKQVFVKLGVRTGNMIELISKELKEGDMIVVDGLTKIYDGADVTIAVPEEERVVKSTEKL